MTAQATTVKKTESRSGSGHVCPPWVAWMLASPLRRLLENPDRMFAPYIRPGMLVLEPGPAMGFFTLPLARMVGPNGTVVAVDIQRFMLEKLAARAEKAGLGDLVNLRLTGIDSLGVDDLAGSFDVAVVIHVLHEVPDQAAFLARLHTALKPGGRLLIREPAGHVSAAALAASLDLAARAGFSREGEFGKRGAVLIRD